MQTCLGINFLSPVIGVALLFWYVGNIFTKGNLCPAFSQIREDRELFLNLSCLQLKIILMPSGMFWGGMF